MPPEQENLPDSPTPTPKKNCFVRVSSEHAKGKYNNEFIMKPLRLPGSRGAPHHHPPSLGGGVTPALLGLQEHPPFEGMGITEPRGRAVFAHKHFFLW